MVAMNTSQAINYRRQLSAWVFRQHCYCRSVYSFTNCLPDFSCCDKSLMIKDKNERLRIANEWLSKRGFRPFSPTLTIK